ncbi:hypothetical protein CK501_04240 [Halovibrio salipaludis]|uniref:Uncharacterized protein n=1 Tax=Halovibrio salipaludis TaxID=2032626 RepID=A0A2A2FBZ4_9GAMM|nr:hypothetical protein [Halovibrio salipaludis]PAU82360.1 hypothetical protein CK501_04240 [Halovibrio salipaludis]
MGSLKGTALGLIGGCLAIGIAWLVDATYFHFRYQKAIEQQVHETRNEPYVEFGLILGIFRLGGYGVGLLFPSVAKRNDFHEIVQALPLNQRYHLIFLFIANMAMVISGVLAWTMIEFFKL